MEDLVWGDPIEQLHEVGGVRDVSVVQKKPHSVDVRIAVEVIDTTRIERACSANDTVDFVAFVEEQLREVRAVLTGDSSDKHFFQEFSSPYFIIYSTVKLSLSGFDSNSLTAFRKVLKSSRFS